MLLLEQRHVPFSGRAASAPLIWGQIAIWDVIEWLPPSEHHTLNLMNVFEVPSGLTLDDVITCLRALIERHESLHTLYRREEVETQCVVGTGAVDLDVYAADDGDLVEQGWRLGATLRKRVFDSAVDLPVRFAVLSFEGAPRVFVLTASHMAVDGWSFRIVSDDLRRLLTDPTGGSLLPAAQEPIERATYEAGPGALRREKRALDFWEQHVRDLPAAMLNRVDSPGQVRLQWAEMTSRALALAVNALAARTRASTSAITLALTTFLLARLTGEQSAAVRMIVATRFKAETERLVGAFNQNALFVLDVQDEDTDDYLRRGAAASSLALRNCEYHPRSLETMVEQVAAQRGIDVGGYCFFNDVRYDVGTDVESGGHQTDMPAEVDAALLETTIVPLADSRIQKGSKFFMYLRGSATRYALQLCAHPGFLTPQSPVDFLADLEWVAVTTARKNLSMAELSERLTEHQSLGRCRSQN